MGRKPLPKNLKMIRGTYRADRDNPDAPNPPPVPKVPKPPPTLNADGRKKWRELAPILQDLGVLAEADLPAFEALCMHYGLMCEAARALKREGLLVKGDRGMVKNPAAQLHRDNSAAFAKYCGLFGLTPADRSRVSAAPGPAKDNPFAQIQSEFLSRRAGR